MTNPMFDLPEEGDPQPQRPRRSQQQEENLFVDQMMYLLTAPHVGYKDDWMDLFKTRAQDITLERFKHHREIFEKEQCTELEAMLYLSTASMEAPMHHDWVDIYMWLFHRWSPEAADANDIPLKELDPNQMEQLSRMRHWIYRTQMNHIKAKSRGDRLEEVAREKERLEREQPRMFDL